MLKHLSSNQLLSYIDGVAEPWATAHIVKCADCRGQVAAKANALSTFSQMIMPRQCPTAHELGEYLLDVLDDEASLDIYFHVVNCQSCQSKLAATTQFLDDDYKAPTYLYPSTQAVSMAPSLSLRSSQTQSSASLTYRIDEAEVNLSFRDTINNGKRHAIWGLVTGIANPQSLVATLRSVDGSSTQLVETDRMGAFIFDDVEQGRHELELRSDSISYVLRGITI